MQSGIVKVIEKKNNFKLLQKENQQSLIEFMDLVFLI